LPYITPTVAAAAVFRVFFSSRPTAPINNLLSKFGVDPLLWLDEPRGIFELLAGAEGALPAWLVGPSLALGVIILYNIWSYVGYDTVIFLAGLGGIPGELYEAASIDGAGRWAQFRHITFPLLSPTTYFLTLLAVIGTFKAFNHVWVLRTAAALGTTDTASIVIFMEFNRNTRYGYAAALSFILLGVILVLTVINNRIAEERVFYG
jgi:multiple sugar transport system permease protein